MKLIQSFPDLTDAQLDKTDAILHERFGYSPTPKEYRAFLLQHNGGFVTPGYIDSKTTGKQTSEIVFDTPLNWVRDNNRSVTPSLVAFFGIWLREEMNMADIENDKLYELILSNEHSREDFDILPDNMLSIAQCSHPDAADILCLSLDKEDYGAVYYRYGMCDHPAQFHGSYYEDNVTEVATRHNINDLDEIDTDTPEGRSIMNELKKATFVKVASSFATFLRNCRETAVVV